MTPEEWQRIDQLFGELLEMTPSQRTAFIDRTCRDDEKLRGQLEDLLSAHLKAASFIETPPAEGATQLLTSRELEQIIGKSIAHYRVSSLLGAGGMGEEARG